MQLATVDPANGRPSVRTVVFRGFLPGDVLAHGDADGGAGGGADGADGALPTDGGDGAGLPTDPALGL